MKMAKTAKAEMYVPKCTQANDPSCFFGKSQDGTPFPKFSGEYHTEALNW
jgi:hypothetical protein